MHSAFTRRVCLHLCLFTLLVPSSALVAQSTAPVQGLHTQAPTAHAFLHATLIPAPGQRLNDATLVVENGIITAVGTGITPPSYATQHDLKGKWIYAAFVDAYSTYGAPAPPKGRQGRDEGPQPNSNRSGPYSWNQAVQPEYDLLADFKPDAERADSLRALGFGAVQVTPRDGIFRGASLAVQLADDDLHTQLLRNGVAQQLSFSPGSSTQDYPNSLMGAIALIRQTLLDAQWYADAQAKYGRYAAQRAPEYNRALEVLSNNLSQKTPFYFVGKAGEPQDLLRAARIAKEFNLPLMLVGTGYEYELLDQLAATKAPVIVPLSFPLAYDLQDPAAALEVNLQQLRRWEQAPANPYWLASKNIPFALTTYGTENLQDFWPNLHKALGYGLTPEQALRALTVQPAQLLGLDHRLGTLEKGKLANLVITTGDLFAPGAVVQETWVQGKQYAAPGGAPGDARGSYQVQLEGKTYEFTIGGERSAYAVKFADDRDAAITEDMGNLVLTLPQDTGKAAKRYRLRARLQQDSLIGTGTTPAGAPFSWRAGRNKLFTPEAAKPIVKVGVAKLAPVTLPNLAFGIAKPASATPVLIQGARVWTGTDKGILEDADVLVSNGKIQAVGKALAAPSGATVVQAKGRQLTAGIIDEHSHIAIDRGVNEDSKSVTSEVRIGDVINPSSINIYRQLAGGVTTAHLLHGSANSIGGQTQVVKLRWGTMDAEAMKFAEAPGFIKFALGENVKQANWGDNYQSRYPQTRLGVEQVIRDAFQAAKDYQQAWEDYRKATGGKNLPADKANQIPPRRDLELDALLEILQGKRYITCHSYVQSEITMLIRLAEQMGFKVNTFTHILEGYKVADKMAKHGAYASTFADWWAYKFEVYEAVPYNAALMTRNGVATAINSDDAEMARRLNQEAAKTVKYGGLSEEEAWKTVTVNPARMLHIDEHVGSIAAGKDADLVLWNGNPLSIYSHPLQTYVDGKLLYDVATDEQQRQALQDERTRLVQAMLDAKKGGAKTIKIAPDDGEHNICDEHIHTTAH